MLVHSGREILAFRGLGSPLGLRLITSHHSAHPDSTQGSSSGIHPCLAAKTQCHFIIRIRRCRDASYPPPAIHEFALFRNCAGDSPVTFLKTRLK